MGNEETTSVWDMIPNKVLISAILILVGVVTGTNIATFNWTKGTFQENPHQNPQQAIDQAVNAALERKRHEEAEAARRLDISNRLSSSEKEINRMKITMDSSFNSISKGLGLIQDDIKRFHSATP